MLLALGATLIVMVALLVDIGRRPALRALHRLRDRLRRPPRDGALPQGYDPGRELRAEQRARTLLQSCVNDEEWAMYAELGFLRVRGAHGGDDDAYAYLIYPHEPIVCYVPATRRLLNEYCVAFPDESRPYGSARLPASDDVLAKWMALTGDERRLIHAAEMHLPDRLIDPERVRHDLWRLERWEHVRAARAQRGAGGAQTTSLRAS